MIRVFDVPLPEGWDDDEAQECVGKVASMMTADGVESWIVVSVEVRDGRLIATCEERPR